MGALRHDWYAAVPLRARPAARPPAGGRRSIWSTANLAGVGIGPIGVVYLAARWSPHQLPADVAELYTAGLSVRSDPGFLMLRYPLFVVLEFLVLHALLYRSLMLQPASGRGLVVPLLLVASASLLALPLFRYGFNNDLAMRASIPALLVTAVVTIAVLGSGRVTAALRGAILLVLAIGGVTTLIELQRHVRAIYLRDSLIAVPAPEEPAALLGLQRKRYAGAYNFLGQYVGGASSPYMRHLAPTAGEPAAGRAAPR
jgi:FtsH-binding integral membrane protein